MARPRPHLALVPAGARPRRRNSGVTAGALALLGWAGVVFLGLLLAPLAYWVGYAAGQRAADEDAVYAAVLEAIHGTTRVALLADSLRLERLKVAALNRGRLELPPAPHVAAPTVPPVRTP